MNYSLPYIILVASLLTISLFQFGIKFDEKSNKFINRFILVVFVLFFGCRGFIGWDWYSYYPFFTGLDSIFNLNVQSKMTFDIGFIIYASCIKTFTKDYQLFIFISTLIDGILLHIFFKRYLPKNFYALAFTLFIVMEGIILETNLMRNIKGLLIFLLSIQYIEKRNIYKFFLFNLIGIFFHWSSVIFLPLYFIIHKKLDLRIFFVIFIVGNIIYLSQIEYISNIIKFISQYLGETVKLKTEVYMDSSISNRPYGITFGYLERIFTSLLIMLYYNKLTNISKTNIIFINCYITFFILYFYFSEVSIILIRLGNLFIFTYWILYPRIIEYSSNSIKYILFIFIAIYLNLKIAKTTDNILYQYDNVLYGKYQTYKERESTFNNYKLRLQQKK